MMNGKDLRLLARAFRNQRDHCVRRFKPIDDHLLESFWPAPSVRRPICRLAVFIVARRNLDLEALEPHLADVARVAHQVAEGAANLKLGRSSIKGGTSVLPFWRMTTPPPLTLTRGKIRPSSRSIVTSLSSWSLNSENDAVLQGLGTDWNRQEGRSKEWLRQRQTAPTRIQSRFRRVSFLYTGAMLEEYVKQGRSHLP